jgi:crotonobetaine/carnitine-CoA ligase
MAPIAQPVRRSAILDAIAAKHLAAERLSLAPDLGVLLDRAIEHNAGKLLWVSVDDGTSLTYRAFGIAVTRCVAALHRLGVQQGTHVGVMLPSIPALAVTWMALAKLGAVMVPVNTRYTAPELDYLMVEADVELLIIDRDYLPLLHRAADVSRLPLPIERIVVHGGSLLGCAGEWQALCDSADASPRLPASDLDRLMTLQFTSGSTGMPKACMLTHRYWITIGLIRQQQGPPVRRLLIDMPFHYMGGQWRFLLALYSGATAFVARQPSLSHMLDRLLAHDIHFCSVTPALAKQALDPGRRALGLVWAATMALPGHLHETIEEWLNGTPVRELYGTTETGAALAMPVAVDWMSGSGSCGLPVPFRKLKIVDDNGTTLPPGGTGELCIGGPGMMLGYYKRDSADALCDGWFRTGDLARCDGDGFHTILGRIKDVIRRSGENISATELEIVLCAMPEIVEAAAIPVPDPMRGEEVKVCVVLLPGLDHADLPPERILGFCRRHLARFKLPRYIAFFSSIPKTASGKIAKQVLRSAQSDLRIGSFDTLDGVWR